MQRETSYLFLIVDMAILGIGIGATLPPLSRTITSGVPLRQIGAATGIFNMVRNLGGPFGIAIAATIFAQRAAEVGQSYVASRLVALGVDASVIPDLPRLRELAQSGATLTPLQQRSLALLRELGPQLQTIQEQARLQALQSAFTDVALIMLAISAVGILATLLVDGSVPKIIWMPDASALLDRFPDSLRTRAHSGFERVAKSQGPPVITRDFMVAVGRGWKARQSGDVTTMG